MDMRNPEYITYFIWRSFEEFMHRIMARVINGAIWIFFRCFRQHENDGVKITIQPWYIKCINSEVESLRDPQAWSHQTIMRGTRLTRKMEQNTKYFSFSSIGFGTSEFIEILTRYNESFAEIQQGESLVNTNAYSSVYSIVRRNIRNSNRICFIQKLLVVSDQRFL